MNLYKNINYFCFIFYDSILLNINTVLIVILKIARKNPKKK